MTLFVRSRMHYYEYADIDERETVWTVPPLLHFIWLGSNIPSQYTDNIKQVYC